MFALWRRWKNARSRVEVRWALGDILRDLDLQLLESLPASRERSYGVAFDPWADERKSSGV